MPPEGLFRRFEHLGIPAAALFHPEPGPVVANPPFAHEEVPDEDPGEKPTVGTSRGDAFVFEVEPELFAFNERHVRR